MTWNPNRLSILYSFRISNQSMHFQLRNQMSFGVMFRNFRKLLKRMKVRLGLRIQLSMIIRWLRLGISLRLIAFRMMIWSGWSRCISCRGLLIRRRWGANRRRPLRGSMTIRWGVHRFILRRWRTIFRLSRRQMLNWLRNLEHCMLPWNKSFAYGISISTFRTSRRKMKVNLPNPGLRSIRSCLNTLEAPATSTLNHQQKPCNMKTNSKPPARSTNTNQFSHKTQKPLAKCQHQNKDLCFTKRLQRPMRKHTDQKHLGNVSRTNIISARSPWARNMEL